MVASCWKPSDSPLIPACLLLSLLVPFTIWKWCLVGHPPLELLYLESHLFPVGTVTDSPSREEDVFHPCLWPACRTPVLCNCMLGG